MRHPSDALYNNECLSLDQAFQLVLNELCYEIDLCREPEEEAAFIKDFKEGMARVRELKSEYRDFIETKRGELMKEWQDRGGWAADFAEAYFSGDYSSLAI